MGPGTKPPSLGHRTVDVLRRHYAEQAAGLIEGGADLLLIEPCQDILQNKAFFFSSRRRHTRSYGDWSSDVCSSDLRRTKRSASSKRAPHAANHEQSAFNSLDPARAGERHTIEEGACPYEPSSD